MLSSLPRNNKGDSSENLLMNFHKTFPDCSLPSTVLKIKNKKCRVTICSHKRCYRTILPPYACTCANHVCYSSDHVKLCSS